MYVRVIALLGYFHLNSQTASYPLRKARWGHLVHGQVTDGVAATEFAEKFRDFLLEGATHLVQLDKVSVGTVLTLDTSKNASNQLWEWHTLYDHVGQLYPTPVYSAPYWGKVYGDSWGDYPLPPFVALRYRRVPVTDVDGRQQYGYVRTVRCGYGNFGGTWLASYAPFCPINTVAAFSHHVAGSLSRSGFSVYHGTGSNREVMLYYRGGVLMTEDVVDYEQDIVTTTSRNFYID
jgi:hypothetical protein